MFRFDADRLGRWPGQPQSLVAVPPLARAPRLQRPGQAFGIVLERNDPLDHISFGIHEDKPATTDAWGKGTGGIVIRRHLQGSFQSVAKL